MTQDPQLSLVGDIGYEWPITEFMGSLSVLRIVDGTRNTTVIGEGLVSESFTVYSDSSANVTQASIRAVENRLSLAHKLKIYPSPNESVELVERVTDEVGTRKATVLGGTITSVDDAIASRTMYRGATMFVITIDRYAMWEYGTVQTTGTVKSVSCHGGTIPIPSAMVAGTQPGRIGIMAITNNLAYETKKFWAGIKSSSLAALDGFDPDIKTHNGTINGGHSSKISDSNAIDNSSVKVSYTKGTDWRFAVGVKLTQFNSYTAIEATRDIYHGRYHLLLRYKTSDVDNGETYGIRTQHGWTTDTNSVISDAVYLKSTNGIYRYVDLGLITIGGESFTSKNIRRAKLANFGIGLQAAVWDNHTDSKGLNDSFLYLDNMQLVPADNYIHVEFNEYTGGRNSNRGAELYTHDNGEVYCLSIARDDQGNTRDSLVFADPRVVYESAPIVDNENWYMPTSPSKLVFVSDSATSELSDIAAVDIEIQTSVRTANV